MLSRRTFLAGGAAGAVAMPSLAAAPRPLRILATNQRMPSGFLSIKAGELGFKYRTLHIIGAPATEIVLGFCGWAVPSNLEVDAPASHGYAKVALEYGGASVPVTFGGGRSVTISGGVPYVLSDPIRAATFGLKTFPRDSQMFVRALGAVTAAGQTLPVGTVATGFDMRMMTFPEAAAIDDIDSLGPMDLPPGATGRISAPGPCLILGRFGASFLSIVCVGDSIADGVGDNARLNVGKGFFDRAALAATGLKAIGSLNLTKPGSTGGTTTVGLGVPGAPGYAYRQALLRFGTVMIDQYGTNTLGGSAAVAAARVVDPSRQLWAVARAAGIQKIIRTTLLPVTISGSQWTTPLDQSPKINWQAGGSRDEINAAFAAARLTGEIDRVADLLHAASDPADDHVWLANGTPQFMTLDGTHPSSEGHRRMGAALRTVYAGIKVS